MSLQHNSSEKTCVNVFHKMLEAVCENEVRYWFWMRTPGLVSFSIHRKSCSVALRSKLFVGRSSSFTRSSPNHVFMQLALSTGAKSCLKLLSRVEGKSMFKPLKFLHNKFINPHLSGVDFVNWALVMLNIVQ